MQKDEILVEFTLKDILIIGVLVISSLMFLNNDLIFNLFLLPIIISFAVLIVCDYKYFILPNTINYFLIIYGIFINYFSFYGVNFTTIEQSLIGFGCGVVLPLILRLLFNRILGRESFGLGDVKMLGGIGAIFGGMFLLQSIFYASILGIIYYIITRILKKTKNQYIPYGSCLGLICLFPLF